MPKKPWEQYGFPPPKSEASTGRLSLVDFEIYSGIEVPNKPFVARLDGWGFHALTKRMKFKRPFDKTLARALAATAEAFFVPFTPTLAYIFSDEINFLFLRPTSFRRVEKIDSVFAGLASSTFRSQFRLGPVSFDCRCIPLPRSKIIPYFIWRQAECFRNHNNAWAQHVLIKSGLSARAAAKKLAGLKTAELRELAKKHKVDFDKTPVWQRNGVLLYREYYLKRGYDPIKKKHVTVERARTKTDWQPPLFREKNGKLFFEKILKRGA